MSIGKDSEGYFVHTKAVASSPEVSIVSSTDFTNISHPTDTRSSLLSPKPTSLLVAEFRQSLNATLDRILPLNIRNFLSRYLFWPLFSGFTSAFTQELFKLPRRLFR